MRLLLKPLNALVATMPDEMKKEYWERKLKGE